MADRTKDAHLVAAALTHLRDLDQQTRAIILALQADHDRTNAGQPDTRSVPIRS